MSKQLGFYIEQDRCSGCKACQVACKDKNDLEVSRLYRKVDELEEGGFGPDGYHDIKVSYLTMACNHCLDPVCVEACPTGAMTKRDGDGVVYIKEDDCIGCKACLSACPYEAPSFNEETSKMGKCDFCMDLLDQGKDPICVGSCPLRALHYGEYESLVKDHGDLSQVKGMPKPDTRPALVIRPHNDGII